MKNGLTSAGWGKNLLHRALLRGFVRTPAKDARAVTEPILCHVIKADFDDQFRTQRLPGLASFRAPTARATRRAAGEARRLNEWLELTQELGAFCFGDTGGEPNVMQ